MGQKKRADVPRSSDDKIRRVEQEIDLAIHCLKRALEAVRGPDRIEVRERLDGALYFIRKLEQCYPRPRAKTGT